MVPAGFANTDEYMEFSHGADTINFHVYFRCYTAGEVVITMTAQAMANFFVERHCGNNSKCGKVVTHTNRYAIDYFLGLRFTGKGPIK